MLSILRYYKHKFDEGDNFPLRRSPNGNFIFIHINKNGGTSIAKAIGLPKKRHLTAQQVISIVGQRHFEKAFKFTVVRNPWSRAVSHYNYRKKTNQTGIANLGISFNDWVYKTYGENKDESFYNTPRMFQTQSDWLKDIHGRIVVDKIIKFEELKNEIPLLFEKLSLDTVLPHLNSTRSIDYRQFYNKGTRKIIQKHFEEDLERFKYVF